MHLSIPTNNSASSSNREGYVILYVLALVTLLGLYGIVSLKTQQSEARAAKYHLDEAQAQYHAESGARLVKAAVEQRLRAGMTLSAALTSLSVSPPTGFEFDTINSFEVLVPDRLFRFISTGRSGDAEVVLEVQYRQNDPYLTSGVFGVNELSSQPNVSVYGYDSRLISNPAPADSNGLASIGSNQTISLGNNVLLDGEVLVGGDLDGNLATTSGTGSVKETFVGYQEPDPLGAIGGDLETDFTRVAATNNNAAVPEISSNTLAIGPGQTVTFPSGEYYFTDFYTPPNTTLVFDDSAGPIQFFFDGPVVFQPSAMTQSPDAYSLQMYSRSTDALYVRPHSDIGALIYAPYADITLWPNGDFKGVVWGDEVQVQPGGEIFVDTSIQERVVNPDLTLHAMFELRND